MGGKGFIPEIHHFIPEIRRFCRLWRPVDLVVIRIPEQYVPVAVEKCAGIGVKGIAIITAVFGELGEEGKKLSLNTAFHSDFYDALFLASSPPETN